MPKGNIFETAFAPGKAKGEYEASLYDVSGAWEKMEWGEKTAEWRKGEREKKIDLGLAATELADTLWGGHKAKKEFKEETLPEMQRLISKKVLGEGATDEQIKGFAPTIVGKGGKEWGKMSMWEKATQEKRYQFGKGDERMIMRKSDIIAEAGVGKYYEGTLDLEKYKTGHKSYVEGDEGGGGGASMLEESQGGEPGPTAQMKEMMGVFSQKENLEGQAPGWDPTGESWYQEEFGEELGWEGGIWRQ